MSDPDYRADRGWSERTRFLGDVAFRFAAQGMGTLKGLVFLPLIARSFDGAAYGIWSQIALSVALLLPLLTLRMESALVQHVDPDISFYGVQPLGLEPGEKVQRTVEDMAARYVEDLQSVQPQGSYMLGGRCFGAFVAFEMAQQLVRSGHNVSLLVLMDPSAPPGVARDARYYAARVGYFKRRGTLIPAVMRYLRARILEFRNLWIRGLLANAPARRLAREQRIHRRAQDDYRPEPYPGTITFLGAQDDYHPKDTRALWQRLTTAGFELHLVPGNHRTITQEPNLRTFARRLGQLIHAARGADNDSGPG